ncbi:MAG: hypothetical protein ACYTFF_01380 [Planctomycetota bacterium]|jgi:hypothetical protein
MQSNFFVATAAVGLCLFAAPAWGQTTYEDGSTIAAGGPIDVETNHATFALGGVLMNNGCIGDGSGWSVSGTNGPFGGFTQFQRFTVPDPGWDISAIGIEGHLFSDPAGVGLLGRVWPDDGTGTGPDESDTPLVTALYFLASDPFSCENWQDESAPICLEPGDYWFQYDDNNDANYQASAKNGTSGGPAFSRRNSDQAEFPHGPLALRIFGAEQACISCPGEGDCCEANGTPACDDEECCTAVCEIDPFCCDTEWDDACAALAQEICVGLCPVLGSLDIKPGSCPNAFNPRNMGKLPVALVGTDDIPAGMVDLSTLLLSRADGIGGSVAPLSGPPGPHIVLDDVATPFDGELCDCHEMYGDGIMDVSMKFGTVDVVVALGLGGMPAGTDVELTLTGSLTDGTTFSANDCIRIVGSSNTPSLPSTLGAPAPGWGSPD